jgi:hypothetical protein
MANQKKTDAPAGQTAPAGETDWRRFPALEKLFSSEEAATSLLAKIEKTCRRLDELSRTGTPAEQARAKAAMTAYGRTLELVHGIRERREQMAAAANK